MSAPMTAGSEITLPPTSRYLGARITITRTNGLTATGRLIAVTEEGIELQLDDGTVTVAPYGTTTSARIAEAQTAPTSEAVVCELAECEQFREWLSGEKAEADKRARQAETERDRLAEQVRVLAEVLKRSGPVFLCSTHADSTDPDCKVCRDRNIAYAALDGTEGDR